MVQYNICVYINTYIHINSHITKNIRHTLVLVVTHRRSYIYDDIFFISYFFIFLNTTTVQHTLIIIYYYYHHYIITAIYRGCILYVLGAKHRPIRRVFLKLFTFSRISRVVVGGGERVCRVFLHIYYFIWPCGWGKIKLYDMYNVILYHVYKNML